MESTEGQSIESMDDWYLPANHNKSARQSQPIWSLAILAVVVFLHAGLIAYLFSLRTAVNSAVVEDKALLVTFIDRILPPTSKTSQTGRVTKSETGKSHVSEIAARKQMTSNQSLLDEQSPLRLTLDNDEWQLLPSAIPKSPLKRQYIALPGRVEPFVEGIKLAGTRSPREKLAMVGKLFGAVDYDRCDEARKRIASGQSQIDEVDLESDLRAIELHCR